MISKGNLERETKMIKLESTDSQFIYNHNTGDTKQWTDTDRLREILQDHCISCKLENFVEIVCGCDVCDFIKERFAVLFK